MIPSPILRALLPFVASTAFAGTLQKPDLVVAADGSGDFTTIQAAVASIPKTNNERMVVLIKDGTYKEKIRVDASYVTLRGESRKGTRIEFPQLDEDFNKTPDDIGRAVINLAGSDFVLENLTAENTAGIVGPHAFTILGRGDRTVIVDCDLLSHGADTVSLWLGQSGRYYHARCNITGSVDFVCPRGWCYMTDCTIYEMKNTAAVWHDGHVDKDMKFVIRNCKFDGVEGWNLARHHVDAQFYFLDCTFSKTMIDKAPFRVNYPNDPAKNAGLDKSNLWGERAYYYNCHRESGDYPWFADNLSTAPGAPKPEEITAAWTFGGKWDPEKKTGPRIRTIGSLGDKTQLVFEESVTVKGRPRLASRGGGFASYVSGSGTDTLVFASAGDVASVDLQGGAIIASEAAASSRAAELSLPGNSENEKK